VNKNTKLTLPFSSHQKRFK